MKMIVDITGLVLTPGNQGIDCLGNGEHVDKNGKNIECCCDECDYLICCSDSKWQERCKSCTEYNCLRGETESCRHTNDELHF